MKEVTAYQTEEGREPFTDWFYSLKDSVIEQRVQARIDRVELGNYGDHKRFQSIIELRMHFGKGYRVYLGEDGNKLVILLAGGYKSSQNQDIKKAVEYWRDYECKKI